MLTGDRPTGRLHLGHYVGSLKGRLEIQEEKEKDDELYIMIADAQALTDNFDNPEKIRKNIKEVLLDYLACGIDPAKVTIFVQSGVSALFELYFYYNNLVTLNRLKRNPTVKDEIKLRGFDENLPMGFLTYPVSQTADITAFDANIVPVGEDQIPMLEQAREIVDKFNYIYGEVLVKPEILLSKNKGEIRLVGIDGKQKMSKSLGNAIFLSDSYEDLEQKVMKMYTDPKHIKVELPGKIEGNVVFDYLNVFSTNDHFKKYLPEFKDLENLKNCYKKGGVGDVLIKKFLIKVLNETLEPIRLKREKLSMKDEYLENILREGTKKASLKADEVLERVKDSMGINYFK